MHNFCFGPFCERTRPHEEPCFSLRGPAIALNRKVPKAPVVWIGEWVGGLVGGDQMTPSIFLISGYINKHDVLILNMASKIVHRHNIKSYEYFKFQN